MLEETLTLTRLGVMEAAPALLGGAPRDARVFVLSSFVHLRLYKIPAEG